MKSTLAHIILIFICAFATFMAYSQNSFSSFIVTDSVAKIKSGQPEWSATSNASHQATDITFTIFPGEEPLIVKKVRWEKIDTILDLLQPLSRIFDNKSIQGKPLAWNVKVKFPYTFFFDENDILSIETNKGIFKIPTSTLGRLNQQYTRLEKSYNELAAINNYNEKGKEHYHILFIIFLIVACLFLCLIVAGFILYSKRTHENKNKVLDLSEKISTLDQKNSKLDISLEELFKKRLGTINILCDEYYEKNGSEATRASVFNEMEKHILSFKTPKTIEDLQNNLNRYYDNIIIKLKEQIPEIDHKDLVFLTYLYSGFSPRAICVFTDTNMKHFYYRRNKIKEILMAADASDKTLFISKIG